MSSKTPSSHRASATATQRLKQDFIRLKKDPIPYVTAEPLPSNILEWHYVVIGPPDTPYAGGLYHGKLVFPREFPFRPPSIYMMTPSGRFKCNTRLCLSISDFHPDTWNPAWCVGTILTGLLSFMVENSATLGSIETSHFTKRQFAMQSGQFNLKDQTFCDLFPNLVKDIKKKIVEARGTTLEADQTSGRSSGDAENENQQPNFANLAIVAGVAIFALFINVLQNL